MGRGETNAVAAYLTALNVLKVPARSRAAPEKRRAQIEQWIAEETSPIRKVELIQQRFDIDAQPAQIDQAQRLGELEEGFVKVAASWAKRTGISAVALREVGVPARVLAKLRSKGEIAIGGGRQMVIKTALTIAGSYLAIAQGLTMILTQTMAALILGVATPFLVLGGCVAYVLERDTRPEPPRRQAAPRIIDVPPRRFRSAGGS